MEDIQPFVLSIEGNIGSGKNTLLNMMHRYLNSHDICVKKEPTYKWSNIHSTQVEDGCNQNILDLFYNDTPRWAFTTQMKTTTCRIKEYDRIKRPLGFCERSWLSDKHVFVPTLYDCSYMTEIECDIYNENYSIIAPHFPNIDGIVYIRSSVDNCMQRLLQKNKNQNTSISFSYLSALHSNYEKWIHSNELHLPVCVIDIDCNELDHNEVLQDSIFRKMAHTFPILKKYLNANSKDFLNEK